MHADFWRLRQPRTMRLGGRSIPASLPGLSV
jgi:hypothetical protein